MASGPPFTWRPGEHVAVVGDTGTGKTWLLSKALLRMRRYVVVFRTKTDDDDDEKWRGFHRIRKASGIANERYERFLLDPIYRDQATEGYKLLETTYRHGRWTVVIDEGFAAEKLGLGPWIERSLTQGRSKGLTVVYGQQRPVSPPGTMVSRFALSQATHVFCFRVEGRDATTIAESTTPRILPLISEQWAERNGDRSQLLKEREFAYYHRAARVVSTGTASRLGAIIKQPGENVT